MAEGRAEESWGRLSCLLALLANAHRDPKKTSPFSPTDFNPYVRKRAGMGHSNEVEVTDFSALKDALTGSGFLKK